MILQIQRKTMTKIVVKNLVSNSNDIKIALLILVVWMKDIVANWTINKINNLINLNNHQFHQWLNILKRQMGAQKSKEKYSDIYLEITDQYFQAGATVKGTVHMNINSDVNFDALYIKLEGKEKVQWIQYPYGQIGGQRLHCIDKREIYTYEFVLDIFRGTIRAGQYSHQFQFTLPANLPGSNHVDDNNYLKYVLSAFVLNRATKKKVSFDQILTVIENPKYPIGPYHFSDSRNPKCCGCFFRYGPTKINIKASSNVVSPGQIVQINVQIDNRMSKKQINNVVISFNRYYARYATKIKQELQETFFTYNRQLQTQKKVIMPGEIQLIEIDFSVPNISKGVSGGQISTAYYAFVVDCDKGSCNEWNCIRSMFYVFPKNPVIMGYKKVQPPQNWHPTRIGVLNYPKQKTYQHHPCQEIVRYCQAYQNPKANQKRSDKSDTQSGIKPNFKKEKEMVQMTQNSIFQMYPSRGQLRQQKQSR